MRISDWSSDVCSSDLAEERDEEEQQEQQRQRILDRDEQVPHLAREACPRARLRRRRLRLAHGDGPGTLVSVRWCRGGVVHARESRAAARRLQCKLRPDRKSVV